MTLVSIVFCIPSWADDWEGIIARTSHHYWADWFGWFPQVTAPHWIGWSISNSTNLLALPAPPSSVAAKTILALALQLTCRLSGNGLISAGVDEVAGQNDSGDVLDRDAPHRGGLRPSLHSTRDGHMLLRAVDVVRLRSVYFV
jgi:hypothetical protein